MEIEEPKKVPYPKAVFFIISNEFCERFSFYGMKSILAFYFTTVLLQSENTATESFHTFNMLSYFSPIIGAIIADSYLGRYRTILYLSIIYATGNIFLSYASWIESSVISVIALLLIAIGTGGIKPCVSAFGGDQFHSSQEKELKQFFALFYLSINLGSLLSTILTPILRKKVSCSHRIDCYPLAFGLPAILMTISVIIFFLGKPYYKHSRRPKENALMQFIKCTGYAAAQKIKSLFVRSSSSHKHWLDLASDKFDTKIIDEAKQVNSIIKLMLPIPLFWALFDQQGSKWTLQAKRMKTAISSFHILPDQMQTSNSLLIVVLIPLFEYCIYPIFNKLNILAKPLSRMIFGGTFAGISFIFAAFLQIWIEKSLPMSIPLGYDRLLISSGLPCEAKLSLIYPNANDSNLKENTNVIISPGSIKDFGILPLVNEYVLEAQASCLKYKSIRQLIKPNQYILLADGIQDLGISLSIPEDIRVIIQNTDPNYNIQERWILHNNENIQSMDLSEGVYTWGNETLDLHRGGIYFLSIVPLDGRHLSNFIIIREPNKVNILWQFIQYFLITCGEVMFSITGLEFAYSQAPKRMKSVIQSVWLLTVSFGNLLVILITKYFVIFSTAGQFFFYALLMFLDMAVFAIIAYYYKPYKEEDVDSSANDNK